MNLFRGDAHNFYLKLKKAREDEIPVDKLEEISEVTDIQNFYSDLGSITLEKILYRMIKEKDGSGMIPIFVSTGPWLLFLFSDQLQEFILTQGMTWGIGFAVIYVIILTLSVILHFREKAWASLHMAIIEDILDSR